MYIWSRYKDYIITGLILALGFLIGLGFGRLQNSNNSASIIIDKNVKAGLAMPSIQTDGTENSNILIEPNYVASINGTTYYPIRCKAADKIKEENKIWFKTIKEAETQGYKPAQNCR